MNNNFVYFSLQPSIYAARFDQSIIILDSNSDTYLSLIDDAAQHLLIIVQQAFTKEKDEKYCAHEGAYDNEKLNFWITHFLERKFITPSTANCAHHIALPLKEGGLCDYQWDCKPSWNPLRSVSIWQLLTAWIMLARVHRIMKRAGIKGLLELIVSYTKPLKSLREPTDQEIATLAEIIDAASVLYTKKTFCLAWATTYVCMSLKRGWKARLVIGVQTNPFYAHAWAEARDKVVHDDPEIAQVLSIILKTQLTLGS
jgi:hypothetical protein